jgi:hypothetical protein
MPVDEVDALCINTMREFGFTTDHVVEMAQRLLKRAVA